MPRPQWGSESKDLICGELWRARKSPYCGTAVQAFNNTLTFLVMLHLEPEVELPLSPKATES